MAGKQQTRGEVSPVMATLAVADGEREDEEEGEESGQSADPEKQERRFVFDVVGATSASTRPFPIAP